MYKCLVDDVDHIRARDGGGQLYINVLSMMWVTSGREREMGEGICKCPVDGVGHTLTRSHHSAGLSVRDTGNSGASRRAARGPHQTKDVIITSAL